MALMSRVALMAPKRAQEQRNAAHALFTWYAPFQGLAVNVFIGAACPSAEKTPPWDYFPRSEGLCFCKTDLANHFVVEVHLLIATGDGGVRLANR